MAGSGTYPDALEPARWSQGNADSRLLLNRAQTVCVRDVGTRRGPG